MKIEKLLSEATPRPWRAKESRIYFANSAGGFDIRNCPNPQENVELIATLVNSLPELVTLVKAARALDDEYDQCFLELYDSLAALNNHGCWREE